MNELIFFQLIYYRRITDMAGAKSEVPILRSNNSKIKLYDTCFYETL